MNTFLLLLVGIPIVEIYLFIKLGSQIGAFNTILLIFITAFFGVIYARYEGFNTLKSGMSQMVKNELPVYEIISGAALAFAALLLILPGFATDFLGLLIIFPPTRKLIFKKVSIKKKPLNKKQDFINGEFEDIEDENVTKIIVITGKGLRSKNIENPYLSKDLSILKYSVPEFIEKNKSLTQFIKETAASIIKIYEINKNKFKE
ncbi:FxsA family protein [Candidatus Pelagibacter bacterium]|nr:FxsA family protein [Candidatus Pelagibacter bacterium]MDA8804982.1 FxsA family protein [Candidatus Pelagibacter bacterium]